MGDWLQDRCNSIQKAQQEHIQKSFSEDIYKSNSLPIGTIHNGFKKIAEGKWRKVSNEGLTYMEHVKIRNENLNKDDEGSKNALLHHNATLKYMFKEQNEQPNKEYSDKDVKIKNKK